MRPLKPHGGAAMFGGLCLALCCTCGVSQTNRSTPNSAAPEGPVLVRIVSRDSTITARASRNGPVYSMQSKDGQVTLPAMTLQELHAQHPGIARRVNAMTAADTATVWAGMDGD